LKPGTEITKERSCDDNEQEGEAEDESDYQSTNISLTKDVLPFILPLSCILTMNTGDRDILEMLNVIKTSP
jgi:hypothetical protein